MRIYVLAFTSILALSGCGSSPSGDDSMETMTVRGTVKISHRNPMTPNLIERTATGCKGTHDFSDLRRGTTVTVLSGSGVKIALGELADGVVEGDEIAKAIAKGSNLDIDVSTLPANECTLSFEITDVPADGAVFSIEVADRGGIDFKKDDSEKITLSLG